MGRAGCLTDAVERRAILRTTLGCCIDDFGSRRGDGWNK
jgi:hypothetical protein